ncbi:hypothetical protein [Dysgonomonas sp. 511]|uniref:hypothetical protein n=1 Tax=Dysgonomonas sp. 511 TaxID=2302930 RepID=UPI0013D0FEE1|nr:hypothetical protein [Dysgonomonas sp. 511]NDV78547.1 hypothetical protein [Dysgonomonas sp. 511]
MRRLLLLLASPLLFVACNQDLENMGEAVRSHFRYRDADKNTITKISYLKAISCNKIPENEQKNSNEEYLCKVYVKGTWQYNGSYRIFNIDDTLDCFFNKNKAFLRIGELIEK